MPLITPSTSGKDEDHPNMNAKEDNRPRRGMWMPGRYIRRCRICADAFIGDKGAIWCADCAYGSAETSNIPKSDAKYLYLKGTDTWQENDQYQWKGEWHNIASQLIGNPVAPMTGRRFNPHRITEEEIKFAPEEEKAFQAFMLNYLASEATELAHACTKAIMFGLEDDWDGQYMPPLEQIIKEYSELQAVVEIINEHAAEIVIEEQSSIVDAKRRKIHQMYLHAVGKSLLPIPSRYVKDSSCVQ